MGLETFLLKFFEDSFTTWKGSAAIGTGLVFGGWFVCTKAGE